MDSDRAIAKDPLAIRQLQFLGGMATAGGWRPDSRLPEIAFAGRSNVGKSSLLNLLLNRRKFARVSNTPGRTREINFFEVNGQFILVDLPGYGYARISKERRSEWKPLIEGYLRHATLLRGVVLLLDVRRDPSPEDMMMIEFLADTGIPTLIAVTKTDKLSAQAGTVRIADLAGELDLDPEQVIPVSAHTGAGRTELAQAMLDLIAQPPWRA
ncbi:MAG: putative GTP-binding protein EngB [Gemmatimonadaceae bacterium]|nr:putative GTP-binding protein EngB [Gemmatimonadaceae bacterium]